MVTASPAVDADFRPTLYPQAASMWSLRPMPTKPNYPALLELDLKDDQLENIEWKSKNCKFDVWRAS
jgi:hypothetical protein